jgi:SET domain-containing protein
MARRKPTPEERERREKYDRLSEENSRLLEERIAYHRAKTAEERAERERRIQHRGLLRTLLRFSR